MKTIYIASKTIHAGRWRQLRDRGAVNIISTWIDEAGVGESSDLPDLARRCIEESVMADGFILYCEPDDVLKGALIEAGARLAFGKWVFSVGDCPSLSSALVQHLNWRRCGSIAEAIEAATWDPTVEQLKAIEQANRQVKAPTIESLGLRWEDGGSGGRLVSDKTVYATVAKNGSYKIMVGTRYEYGVTVHLDSAKAAAEAAVLEHLKGEAAHG